MVARLLSSRLDQSATRGARYGRGVAGLARCRTADLGSRKIKPFAPQIADLLEAQLTPSASKQPKGTVCSNVLFLPLAANRTSRSICYYGLKADLRCDPHRSPPRVVRRHSSRGLKWWILSHSAELESSVEQVHSLRSEHNMESGQAGQLNDRYVRLGKLRSDDALGNARPFCADQEAYVTDIK